MASKDFTQLQSTTNQRKPFKEEWLGFSGQDARKNWFWNACDSVKQKDLLVTLASWQESLAH
ncbi:hypothetical protein VRK_13380 [Vibrio sp. MEBiC08052]|nr:hypothetical protein VRK_13380 [Vibrio sp. MEBiC08052]